MKNRFFSAIFILALIALPLLSACGSAHTVAAPEGDNSVEMGYGSVNKDDLT